MTKKELMSGKYHLNVKLNPDSVVNQVSIQAGESLRLFALITEIFDHAENIKIPDVQNCFPMWSVSLSVKSTDELKQDMLSMMIETAMSNLMRSISECLDEFTWYMELYNFFIPQRKLLSDDFNRFRSETAEILKGQHKSALKNRLEWIDMRYGIISAHKSSILTLNDMRNCYVHRKGLVTDLDINDSIAKSLKIEYLRPFVFVVRDGEEVEVVAPFRLHDGEVGQRRAKEEHRAFIRGERIKLTLREFGYICFSCWNFAVDLAGKLPIVGKSNESQDR